MQKSYRKKNRSVLMFLAVFAVFAYISVSFFRVQSEINSRRLEQQKIQDLIEAQTDYNNELEELLENGTETDYIERIAREKLGYAYADEKIYIDKSKN